MRYGDKLILEIDTSQRFAQHYEPIEFFGGINNFIAQQKRDYMKLEYCKNNQIPLFIIKYNENIKERLEEILNELYGQ